VSLGGPETILCFPCQTSHVKLTAEERAKIGISDTLLRISVGIEDIDDIIADFEQALA
jgi:cystathionine beta-lyase/cystathionine gamma-synthase